MPEQKITDEQIRISKVDTAAKHLLLATAQQAFNQSNDETNLLVARKRVQDNPPK